MTQEEYMADVKNVKGKRKHRLTNSYIARDYYRYYRKTSNNKNLTEPQFTSILDGLFNAAFNCLRRGEDFKFPYRMGFLEIRKMPKKVKIKDGKLRTNLPIDWNETLKLWYSDKKSRDNKKLVRCDVDEIFRVFYNKKEAIYNNKLFMIFRSCRRLKLALKEEINNNNLDSFLRT